MEFSPHGFILACRIIGYGAPLTHEPLVRAHRYLHQAAPCEGGVSCSWKGKSCSARPCPSSSCCSTGAGSGLRLVGPNPILPSTRTLAATTERPRQTLPSPPVQESSLSRPSPLSTPAIAGWPSRSPLIPGACPGGTVGAGAEYPA
jgi:hypothetical protein